MVTKGIITKITKGIDNNYFSVRIPIFEAAGSIQPAILDEVPLCYGPGNLNGYKVGDIVYVGFENNEANNPVVLGKLWLGEEAEATNYANLNALNVKGSTTLSKNTKIGDISYVDLLNKQDKLIAGANISIEDNIISSTGGGSDIEEVLDEDTTTVNYTFVDNTDITYSNASISSIALTVPDVMQQGFLCCVTFSTLSQGLTLSLTNLSTYPLQIVENNAIITSYTTARDCRCVMFCNCDGKAVTIIITEEWAIS